MLHRLVYLFPMTEAWLEKKLRLVDGETIQRQVLDINAFKIIIIQ